MFVRFPIFTSSHSTLRLSAMIGKRSFLVLLLVALVITATASPVAPQATVSARRFSSSDALQVASRKNITGKVKKVGKKISKAAVVAVAVVAVLIVLVILICICCCCGCCAF